MGSGVRQLVSEHISQQQSTINIKNRRRFETRLYGICNCCWASKYNAINSTFVQFSTIPISIDILLFSFAFSRCVYVLYCVVPIVSSLTGYLALCLLYRYCLYPPYLPLYLLRFFPTSIPTPLYHPWSCYAMLSLYF